MEQREQPSEGHPPQETLEELWAEIGDRQKTITALSLQCDEYRTALAWAKRDNSIARSMLEEIRDCKGGSGLCAGCRRVLAEYLNRPAHTDGSRQ